MAEYKGEQFIVRHEKSRFSWPGKNGYIIWDILRYTAQVHPPSSLRPGIFNWGLYGQLICPGKNDLEQEHFFFFLVFFWGGPIVG